MASRVSPERRAVFEIWGIVAEAIEQGGIDAQIHRDRSYYIRIGKNERAQWHFVYDSSTADPFANPASRPRVCHLSVGRFLQDMGPLASELAHRYFVRGGFWRVLDSGRAFRDFDEQALRWYEHPMLNDLILRYHKGVARAQRGMGGGVAKNNAVEP